MQRQGGEQGLFHHMALVPPLTTVTASGKDTSQQLPSHQGDKSTREEQGFKGQPVTKVL